MRWLDSVPPDQPALYCSRTRLVDERNRLIGLSPEFSRTPGFANALMQNIGGGNTMVFNEAARDLLRRAGGALPVTSHDWWSYMLVSGAGGQVFYDRQPSLRYRQHPGNLIGMNGTWRARLGRIRMLWQGRFRQWNDDHVAALDSVRDLLTPANREVLDRFARARGMSLLPRLLHLKRCGVYRQTLLGNLGLIAAAIFGKI